MVSFYLVSTTFIQFLHNSKQPPMSDALMASLCCPITKRVMLDPVILVCSGLSYERSALRKWIDEKGTNPESGAPLQDVRVAENPCLQLLIEAIVESLY